MITVEEYLNRWKVHYGNVEVDDGELTDQLRANAQATVDAANQLFGYFGHTRPLSSGWRPQDVNDFMREQHKLDPEKPDAALHSTHITCCGIDIADPDNVLDDWIDANLPVLDELNVWRESTDRTHGWVHIQIAAYGSWEEGKPRTFKP